MEKNLEKMLEDIERRMRDLGKMLEEIEGRLKNLEKKIDWLIEYLGFGLYQREIIVKPSTGTGEEKESIKYYREPTSTDGNVPKKYRKSENTTDGDEVELIWW